VTDLSKRKRPYSRLETDEEFWCRLRLPGSEERPSKVGEALDSYANTRDLYRRIIWIAP
jgi:hypothetical protein